MERNISDFNTRGLIRVASYLIICLASAHHSILRHVSLTEAGARCSSVVRAFDRGAMGRRIDPS